MKRIFYVILLGFMSLQLSAQNYTYTQLTGGTVYPYSNYATVQPTTLLAAPANDVLSSSFSLPFAWSFYGKSVSSFKVSDNGYITFDPNASVSYSVDSILSGVYGPQNAIFAFWYDLDLRTFPNGYAEAVTSWTSGNVGNRIYHIKWDASIHSLGNFDPTNTYGNHLAFSIRIFETGGFDVVYNFQEGYIGSSAAVVGSRNSDGTLATSVAGSPAINFPVAYETQDQDLLTDDVIYRFGNPEPKVDLSIEAGAIPEQMTASGANLSLYVEDRGTNSDSAQNYSVNVSINGGSATTLTSPKTINPNQIATLTASIPGSGLKLGRNVIKAWVSCPYDHIHTNDTISGTTFVALGSNKYEVHPVVEEPTGVWCGYCPNGMQAIEELLAYHSDAIVVCIHSEPGNVTQQPNVNDEMGTLDGQIISEGLQAQFPSFNINRVLFYNQSTNSYALSEGFPAPGPGVDIGAGLMQLYNAVRYQSDGVSPAMSPIHMDITQEYNSSSRQLTVTLRPKFSDSVLRYKLYYNVYLEENGVEGHGAGWDQHIYGSYQIPESEFYNYPGAYVVQSGVWAMPNFVHQHVFRAALGHATGVQPTTSQLPANYSFDTEYPVKFTYTIPSDWNDKNINIIGFANYYDGNINNNNQILGANQLPMSTSQTMSDIKQVETPAISINSVYPNPSNGQFSADITFTKPATTDLMVSDISGKTIMTMTGQKFGGGIQSESFNLSNLSPGIYFLTIKSDEGSSTQKIIISK